MPSLPNDTYSWSYFVVPVITAAIVAVFGFVSARRQNQLSARDRDRAAAEAALIGTGPLIIAERNKTVAEQNERIATLYVEVDRLWKELNISRIAERECQDELALLRRRLGREHGGTGIDDCC